MNKQLFLKYFPSFLILIGVLLWLNSLFFSTVTNQSEIKLVNYCQKVVEQSSSITNFNARNLQIMIEKYTVWRFEDQPLNTTSEKILALKDKTIEALDKKIEQADTSTYEIIQDFKKNMSELLLDIKSKNPLISDKEMEYLLKWNYINRQYLFDDVSYNLTVQKNQVYQNTYRYIDFLSNKISSGCCMNFHIPTIAFDEKLTVGKKQTGEVFLTETSCYPNMKFQFRMNGQSFPVKERRAKVVKTFKNTSPQILDVEFEFQNPVFKDNTIHIDTFILEKQFIIHPIKK